MVEIKGGIYTHNHPNNKGKYKPAYQFISFEQEKGSKDRTILTANGGAGRLRLRLWEIPASWFVGTLDGRLIPSRESYVFTGTQARRKILREIEKQEAIQSDMADKKLIQAAIDKYMS